MRQGWGMTETSPLAALAIPPANGTPDEDVTYSSKTGRVVAGVQMRVVGPDGQVLPNDGLSVGEFEVRGPWITGSYFKEDDSSSFHDGWLRTGDVGHLDELGFMQITDRTKDVIKSGGEWISSVELEGLVAAHPDVFEAAVIATPDERWSERPLVCVVLKEGRSPSPEALAAFLADKVAGWQVPEYWAFVDEIPKTSVGKFNKLALRALNAAGEIQVNRVEVSSVVPSTQSGGAVAEPSIPGTPLDAQSRGAR